MPGMDLARSKIPFVSPNWTLARIVRYAAKLVVFILVPGLHQIASNRRLLGGLLLVSFFTAEIVFGFLPYRLYHDDLHPTHMAGLLSKVFQYFCWFLLALDLKGLEARSLRPGLPLALMCAAGVYFVPYHYADTQSVHVEKTSDLCPKFCRYDIIEYEVRTETFRSFSPGEAVVADVMTGHPYTVIVLATPDIPDGDMSDIERGNWRRNSDAAVKAPPPQFDPHLQIPDAQSALRPEPASPLLKRKIDGPVDIPALLSPATPTFEPARPPRNPFAEIPAPYDPATAPFDTGYPGTTDLIGNPPAPEAFIQPVSFDPEDDWNETPDADPYAPPEPDDFYPLPRNPTFRDAVYHMRWKRRQK